MPRRVRTVIYLGTLAILIAAFLRVRMINTTSDQTVIQDVSTVDKGDIVLTVSASGSVSAMQQVSLSFSAVGAVSQIMVKEGDHVLKGQTLARLDTQSQETALKNAQLAVNLQQVALNALTNKPRDVDIRASKAAVDAAKAQLAAAGIGYDATQVKIAQLNVELAKNLAWQSQLQRDQTKQFQVPNLDLIGELYSRIANSGLPDDQKQRAYDVLANINGALSAGTSLLPSAQQAEAQVHAADLGVPIAQAQLDQTQGKHGDYGSIAAAQAAIISAQASLDRLIEGPDANTIKMAQAQLDAAQAALDLTQYNLSLGSLTAPFDGVVATLNLTIGEAAPLNKPAVVLLDDTSYYIEIPVDEVDISKVKESQLATLALDSLPGEEVVGKVNRIAPTSLKIGDVVTYLVRIDLDSTGHTLRTGMSATATITVDRINNVVRVRNRFVRLDRKTNRATVIVRNSDGGLSEIEIKLGLRNDTFSEVISGLNEGQTIVVLPRETKLLPGVP